MIFMNDEEFLTNEKIERLRENMTAKYMEATGITGIGSQATVGKIGSLPH